MTTPIFFGLVDMRSRRTNDLTGKTFGRLIVLRRDGYKGTNLAWKCKCDCGQEKTVRGVSLMNGDTLSCGCLQRDMTSAAATVHGMSKTPEYMAWRHMQSRCFNPNVWNYSKYGGRGITVSPLWINGDGVQTGFECFIDHIGVRPSSKHSIDRFPNRDGNYEPGNVRWATLKEQSRNRDCHIVVEFRGRKQALIDWASELGLKYQELHRRIHTRKWSVEKALSTPFRKWTKQPSNS